MSKDVFAASIGGRRMRMIGLLAAAVLAASLVPWVSAETAQPHGLGPRRRPGRGQVPLLRLRRPDAAVGREVLRPGRDARLPRAAQARSASVGRRPDDPGAAEHRRRLVHAQHRRMAGRARLDQQHLPQERRPVHADGDPSRPHRRLRRGRAPGRDACPGGRARRQEGRPDRVGGRPQRRHRRPDRRLPRVPLGSRRGDELHRADRPRDTSSGRSVSSSTTRRASTTSRPSPPRRRRRRPAGPTSPPRSAPRRRCACG